MFEIESKARPFITDVLLTLKVTKWISHNTATQINVSDYNLSNHSF
jgi:hypothetical protein